MFSALAKRASTHTGKVFPLHVGDTWREPWPGLRAEAVAGEMLYTYAPVRGEPALLAAARAQCERRAGPLGERSFTVVSGATSGISVVMQTLCDVGDEVLLPAPFWPLVRGIIASRGAVPVEVPLWDRRGAVDVEAALEAAVTPRTVALYVNSPHNPTGGILSAAEAAAFARVAERHGLWLVVDEVYEHLWFGDEPPEPLWARKDFMGRSVAVHSLSKAYGFAGGRVGWVHGPMEVMERVVATQTHQVYCAPKVMQLAAARALDGVDGAGAWLEETRALYREAGRKTAAAFGVEAPRGGTFLFVDASPWLSDGADVTELLVRLLDEAGVLLTPGVSSGRDYGRWMRVCFTAVAPDVLDEALGRVRTVLDRVDEMRARMRGIR